MALARPARNLSERGWRRGARWLAARHVGEAHAYREDVGAMTASVASHRERLPWHAWRALRFEGMFLIGSATHNFHRACVPKRLHAPEWIANHHGQSVGP
jgi:hypothetical protein